MDLRHTRADAATLEGGSVEIAMAIAKEWAFHFSRLLESMTGNPAEAVVTDAPPEVPLSCWEQHFRMRSRSASFGVGIDRETSLRIGGELLRAAGVEGSQDEEASRTCIEVMAEACAGVARTLSARFGTEVLCEGGRDTGPPSGDWPLFGLRLNWGGVELSPLALSVDPKLESLCPACEPAAPRPNPKALELLMEVELPVSISFGGADMQLKDVLRLASGSIIELNRGASEPVDLIVNNCVIARGEVVVIDGNYGVRIQEIATRQERLRTVI